MFQKYIRAYFPLHITNFTKIERTSETITSDYYKKYITYLDKTSRMMVYVEYKQNTGQIGSFYITNEKYRNRGLGGQILEMVIDDIRKHGATRVWLVPNKYPHPFWEKNGFIYKALFTHPIFSPFHRKMNLPAYFAEYFGTFLFILSILASGGNPLVIGATLAFIIFMIAGLGAGHVNPAVSLAFYLAGTLTPVDLFSYIGAQFFGGISAYYTYRYVTK